MTHRIAALALLLAAVVTAGLLLTGSSSTTSPVVTAAQTVCDTDTSCAAWSLANGEAGDPLTDDAGAAYCLEGAQLYDTEDPAQGDQGIVCAPAPVVGSHAVSEGDPAFDCRYDGNQQCGPTAAVGAPITVTMPQGYQWVECSDPTGRPTTNALGVQVCDYSSASSL